MIETTRIPDAEVKRINSRVKMRRELWAHVDCETGLTQPWMAWVYELAQVNEADVMFQLLVEAVEMTRYWMGSDGYKPAIHEPADWDEMLAFMANKPAEYQAGQVLCMEIQKLISHGLERDAEVLFEMQAMPNWQICAVSIDQILRDTADAHRLAHTRFGTCKWGRYDPEAN